MNEFQDWIFNSKKLLKTEVPRGLSETLHWGETRSDIGEYPKIGPKGAACPQRAGTWGTLPSLCTPPPLCTPPRLPTQVESDSAIPSVCTRPTALKKPIFQDSCETNPLAGKKKRKKVLLLWPVRGSNPRPWRY